MLVREEVRYNMTAEKGNKVYTIIETEKKSYIEQGFDIRNEEGHIIDYGQGKTVNYNDYVKLKEEIKQLKKKIESTEVTKSEKPTKTVKEDK